MAALSARPRNRRLLPSRAYLATRILRQAGFPAANLGDGYKTYQLFHPKANGVY